MFKRFTIVNDKCIKKIFLILIIALYSLGMIVLFYNYIVGKQFSDFGAHIKEAVNGEGYSMAHVLLKICYITGHGDKLISLMMTAVVLLTALVIACFIRAYVGYTYFNRIGWGLSFLIGITATLITQIYIPFIYPHFYVHDTTVAPNIHNTTFLFMRLFGWIVLLLYFYLSEHYFEEGKWRYYIAFTVSLALVNFAKPNFILGFAPAMLLVLIYDFLKNLKKGNKRAFLYTIRFGICVLLSLPIVLIQAQMVYDDGSSIIFSLRDIKHLFNYPNNFVLVILTNVGFPIIAYIICCVLRVKENIKMRRFNQAWLMYLISYSEKLFMRESGARASHGNYAWGSYFFGCVLHIVALTEMIKLYKRGIIKKTVFREAVSIYVLQVISGVSYFIYCVNGGNVTV